MAVREPTNANADQESAGRKSAGTEEGALTNFPAESEETPSAEGLDSSPPLTSSSVSPFPNVEPMTLSLMAKLFGVPLLIIGMIVGGAVLVVVLFGAPSTTKSQSLEDLLQTLEATSGEKSMGVLLPKEKELWQTALELAMRLENKDKEFPGVRLQSAASRIGSMIQTGMGHVDSMVSTDQERVNQRNIRSKRLVFLIHALGQTEQPEAIDILVDVVQHGADLYAQAAIQQLANLRKMAGIDRSVEPILQRLRGPNSSETKLIGYTALSVLATPADQSVIDFLSEERLSGEGEVEWSAALALARLGSLAGKVTLIDMLDRVFWETGDRYRKTDASGKVHHYPMPEGRIAQLLIATVEAASSLNDSDVREMITQLKADRSPAVRDAALKAIEPKASSEGTN